MKLSEAMRCGAKMKPQVTGYLYNAVGTCALGAALDAEFTLSYKDMDASGVVDSIYELIREVWPISAKLMPPPVILTEQEVCRLIGSRINVMYDVTAWIILMNDALGFSRERIADWVESLEKSLEEKPVSKLSHMTTKEILDVMLEGHPEPVKVSNDLVQEILKETIQLKAH